MKNTKAQAKIHCPNLRKQNLSGAFVFNNNCKISGENLLLVDDVFDTGVSLQTVIAQLEERAGDRMSQDLKIATLYYKPENNRPGPIIHPLN